MYNEPIAAPKMGLEPMALKLRDSLALPAVLKGLIQLYLYCLMSIVCTMHCVGGQVMHNC